LPIQGRPGCQLTTTFVGNTAIQPVTPTAPKRRGWLPLLTLLFLLSYGLMTMLIVEQGVTIESQRALIHELFRDSTDLSAVKNRAVTDKNHSDQKHRAPTQAPAATPQSPSAQDSAAPAPSTQAPSSQATAQRRTPSHSGKTQKPQLQLPARPAADLADDRRTLITI
jgi:cytoskeletal protein RodZ